MVRVMTSRRLLGVLLGIVLYPMTAAAQSVIAGTVTDSSGGVLPGVTVEVSSPALIEQTRDAVTRHQRRVPQSSTCGLAPIRSPSRWPASTRSCATGSCSRSDFTATVNAQMKVGGSRKRITVSGASPVVDVQSTMSRTVLSKEQIEVAADRPQLSEPGGDHSRARAGGFRPLRRRRLFADVAGHGRRVRIARQRHGARSGRHERDDAAQPGSIAGVYHNQGAYQEMSYQVVAGSADSQTGGVRINMIPKEGGNRFSGDFLGTVFERALPKREQRRRVDGARA